MANQYPQSGKLMFERWSVWCQSEVMEEMKESESSINM